MPCLWSLHAEVGLSNKKSKKTESINIGPFHPIVLTIPAISETSD